jgi:hypothetical protein
MRYQIRAQYTATSIRVYQAYSPAIAKPALEAGRFVPPFKMGRMTWIKPSFNWMMYRCGYGRKEGQEVVLGIDITREGLEWALARAALSHPLPGLYPTHEAWKAHLASSPVRVQWDPERRWDLSELPDIRSIQIGLSGQAVERYVNEWITGISDVTPIASRQHASPERIIEQHPELLERPYPLPEAIAERLVPKEEE